LYSSGIVGLISEIAYLVLFIDMVYDNNIYCDGIDVIEASFHGVITVRNLRPQSDNNWDKPKGMAVM